MLYFQLFMFTTFIIAFSLSLDSFATAVGLSLRHKKHHIRTALLVSFVFAFFQTLMPLLGYLIGHSLFIFISRIDHWIAFVLLSGVGIKFIMESFESDDAEKITHLNAKVLYLLGLATSIDAFVVGITFAVMPLNIVQTLSIIGLVTFICSLIGFLIGKKLTHGNSKRIEMIGGIVLILIGIKILLTHLVA